MTETTNIKLSDVKRSIEEIAFATYDLGSTCDLIETEVNHVIDYYNSHPKMSAKRRKLIIKGVETFSGTDLKDDALSIKAGDSYFMDAFGINKTKIWHLVDYTSKLLATNVQEKMDKANRIIEKLGL